MKSTTLILATLLCARVLHAQEPPPVTPGSAQWRELFDPPYLKPTEVSTDSPLRRQLFDLLRPAIERSAKRSVQFRGSLRVFKNWALFLGNDVDEGGREVAMPPMGNSDTVGLFLRTSEGWRLVDGSGGHSDAFYLVWTERYGAPKALIDER